MFEYCKAVRADAVPLVDAFNLSDFVVGSPFGRYDGDIYTHYFDKVRRARTLSTTMGEQCEFRTWVGVGRCGFRGC